MYRPCSFIFPHPAFKTSFSFLATHMCMCMCMCMHMHMHMLYAWGVQLKTRKSRKKNRIKSKNKNNVELCSQCTSTLAAVTTGGNVRTMSDQHESSPCPARAPHEARPALVVNGAPIYVHERCPQATPVVQSSEFIRAYTWQTDQDSPTSNSWRPKFAIVSVVLASVIAFVLYFFCHLRWTHTPAIWPLWPWPLTRALAPQHPPCQPRNTFSPRGAALRRSATLSPTAPTHYQPTQA